MRTFGVVRFQDNQLRWFIFEANGDYCYTRLFDSQMHAWGASDAQRRREVGIETLQSTAPVSAAEPVDIFIDYLDGLSWKGAATRQRLIGPLEPYDTDGLQVTQGTPDWVQIT